MLRRTPLNRGGSLKRGKPINNVSERRKLALYEYGKKRKKFLAARPVCECWLAENGWRWLGPNPCGQILYMKGAEVVMAADLFKNGAPSSRDLHHVHGRYGSAYLDENTWMAVSRESHDWIHAHGTEARALGWLK